MMGGQHEDNIDTGWQKPDTEINSNLGLGLGLLDQNKAESNANFILSCSVETNWSFFCLPLTWLFIWPAPVFPFFTYLLPLPPAPSSLSLCKNNGTQRHTYVIYYSPPYSGQLLKSVCVYKHKHTPYTLQVQIPGEEAWKDVSFWS